MVNMVICGLGNISKRVANGCIYAKNMNLYGFYSRDISKAKEYCAEFNVDKSFDSIDEVYKDENVHVLYFSTPNYLHFEQIKDALNHAKHVICEKPIVTSVDDWDELVDIAYENNCFLMEAHKTACSPLNEEIAKLIDQGIIGDIYHIDAEYSCDIRKQNLPKNHWVLNESGGVSRDIGVYPVCFSHYFANSAMLSHFTVKTAYQDYNCDFYFQSLIEYENGITSSVKSSWLHDVEDKGCGIIYGTKGYIKVPTYWKGKEAYIVKDGITETITVDFESDFAGQIDHAAKCILAKKIESNIITHEFSRSILEVIE